MASRVVSFALRDRARRIIGGGLIVGVALVIGLSLTASAAPDPNLVNASSQVREFLGFIDSLDDEGPFAGALPISTTHVAEQLGIFDVLDDVQSALDAADNAVDTEDALENALDSLDHTYAAEGVTIAVDGPSGDVPVVEMSDGPTPVVDIVLKLTATGEIDVPISLATDVADLLASGGDGTFPVMATVETSVLQLRFDSATFADPSLADQALALLRQPDVSLAPGAGPPTISVRLQTDPDPGDPGDPATLVDFTANVGFAAVNVTGTVGFDFGFDIELLDPDASSGGLGDGKITLDELTGTAFADLASVTQFDDPATDTVNASLSLSAAPLVPTPIGVTYVAASPAALATAEPQITNPINDLDDFRNVSADEALQATLRLVSVLQGLQSSGFLDIDLPFVDGPPGPPGPEHHDGSFSDALAVGDLLLSAITDLDGPDADNLPDDDGDDSNDLLHVSDDPTTPLNEAGRPLFDSVQGFETKLEQVLGLDDSDLSVTYDVSTRRLAFDISELLHDDSTGTPVALGLDAVDILSAVTVNTGGTAVIDADYGLDLSFAIDLSDRPEEDGSGPRTCSDGIDNGSDGAADALDTDCASETTLEQRVQLEVGDETDTEPELVARAGVTIENAVATARIGMLEAGISNADVVVGSELGEDGGGITSCTGGVDDDSDSLVDMADPDCRAAIAVDLTDPEDGWLTIEELFNTIGESDPAPGEPSVAATFTAGIHGTIPVSAAIGSVDLGTGNIVITGGDSGPVDQLANLLDTIDVDTTDLHAQDFSRFSPCSNDKDDDGDGVVNDGCEESIPAVDEPEASSLALLRELTKIVHELADSLAPDVMSTPIPLLGSSADDLLRFADSLDALATGVDNAGESAIENGCTGAGANRDDDFDGLVDDGCPTSPGGNGLPEAAADCLNTTDDDADGDANDGCPPGVPSLQHLARQLDGYLTALFDSLDGVDLGTTLPGFDPLTENTVSVGLDYQGGTDNDLVLDLQINGLGFQRDGDIAFDLGSTVPALASIDADTGVHVDVTGDARIVFGIDLGTFDPFVGGASFVEIGANAAVEDLHFSVGIGGLQASIGQSGDGTGEDEGGLNGCGGSDTDDDDGDGAVNDGCPPVGVPETGAQCENAVDDAEDDTDDTDPDGVANDGCPDVADNGRLFLGASARADVVGTVDNNENNNDADDDAEYALPAVQLEGAFGGSHQTGCDDVDIASPPAAAPSPASQEKDACAILPLFADLGAGEVPLGTYPTGHHIEVAVVDLTNPQILVDFDTAALLAAIQNSIIDMVLLQSGIDDLLDALQSLLESDLLSFALPLIGDGTADAAAIVQSLRDTIKAEIDDFVNGNNGTNPLDSIPVPDAGDVQDMVNNLLREDIAQALLDAGLLLDGDDPGTGVTTDDFTVTLTCGDDAHACDTGQPEGDTANTGNCAGNADDDHDGFVNDGCPAVGIAETGVDCADNEDAKEDDDPTTDPADESDGVVNDGCPTKAEPATAVTGVEFAATIGQVIDLGTAPLDFDLALPGLNLTGDAALNGNVTWALDLGFGVSKDLGFYFIVDEDTSNATDATPELDLSITGAISPDGGPAASLSAGLLGFLAVSATDMLTDDDNSGPDQGRSTISGSFVVDVRDPGSTNDGRLTFTELLGGPDFDELIRYSLAADANVDLQLKAGVDPDLLQGLPEIQAQLHIDWHFGVGNGGTLSDDAEDLDPSSGAGSSLDVSLDNVFLNAGSFINNFLAPVFADVQRFTQPFQPIIDVLNEPIPVLSDFAGEPVTLLTLAETFGPDDQNLDLIIAIVRLIDFINGLDFSGGEILIPIGDGTFALAGERLQDGPLATNEARSAYAAGELEQVTSAGSLVDDINGSAVGQEGSSELKVDALDSIGVSFPFLEDPAKLLGVLFGQDVDLILWQPPALSIGFSYSQKFGPIWAVPPVFLEIGGSVSVTGQFGMGYDTEGFRAALFDDAGPSGLLRGLFLIDRHPLVNGSDTNELELRGELFANAQVSVLIFSAGAEGSIFLTIGLDLQDPNGDGKLKFAEVADIIRTTGNVLCIFNFNGQFGVRISVFAEVDLFFWSQKWTKTLAEIILFEFKVECEPLPDPVLAHAETVDSVNVLFLHIGTRANLRDPEAWGSNRPGPLDDPLGSTGDAFGTPSEGNSNVADNSVGAGVIDEEFTVVRSSPGSVTVTAFGISQEFVGNFGRIVGDADTGKDVIALLDGNNGDEIQCDDNTDSDNDGKVNDGCPVTGDDDAGESGTACNDNIDSDGDGTVNDGCPPFGDPIPFDIPGALTGGDGDDRLTSGIADDLLDGGGGADQLRARTGNNILIGGGGADTMGAEGGNDWFDGGADPDVIDAGPGADVIIGGDGDDQIDGGRTYPVPPGTPESDVHLFVDGADRIDAGNGADTIDAGDGNDLVLTGAGKDRANGGGGNDILVDGGVADATCYDGDTEDDVLVGGPGNDAITAGEGDDLVVGGSLLADEPDVGETTVPTLPAAVAPVPSGGTVPAVPSGLAGGLHGGNGCDIVVGDNGTQGPGGPFDLVSIPDGQGGGDTITGGNGSDKIYGATGGDTIRGDEFVAGPLPVNDDADETMPCVGSAINDGCDVVFADDQAAPLAVQGNDTMSGDGGDDALYGYGGNDRGAGGLGDDLLVGGDGDDTLAGDLASTSGAVDLHGGGGNDTLQGGNGNDHLYGQGGSDNIAGDSGNDEAYGDGDEDETDASDGTGDANPLLDGNDLVRGGVGNDLLFGNNRADDVFGDAGTDRIIGGSPNANSVDNGTGPDMADPDDVTSPDDALGQLYGDELFGGSGDDIILGDNGTVIGSTVTLLSESTIGQGDLLFGEQGEDRMFGENGDDRITGGSEDDHAEGGDDGDTIFGNSGHDDLIGGTTEPANPPATGKQPDGGDTISGGTGADVAIGDNGEILRNGQLEPDGSPVRLVTLYDNDDLTGAFSGEDIIDGNEANDRLYGGAEHDVVHGNAQDDHVEGNNGDDDLYGDDGQDNLVGGTSVEVDEDDVGGGEPDVGKDQLYGGAGHDVLAGDNASIRRIVIGGSYVFDDLDTGRGIVDVGRRQIELFDVATLLQPLTGTNTSDGDELFGEGDYDIAYGQGGGDLLDGGAVDDHLEGNAGSDIAYGGGGQDDIIGGTGRTVSDDATTATDGRLDTNDFLYGGDGANGIAAGDDFDVVMGDNAIIMRGAPLTPPPPNPSPGSAWDINDFNGSVKRAVFLYDVGIVGFPVHADTNGGDFIRGEADDDVLYGQGDGDDIGGAGGDDYMEGNEGVDTMTGDAGNDDMIGGTGRINLDPPGGVDGRLDSGELLIAGGPGFDWIAGDNAVVVRVLNEDGEWVPNTFNDGIQHERIFLRDVATISNDDPLTNGTSGAEVLIRGDADDDVIYGQGGSDVDIQGNAGDDYIEGNVGSDTIHGGADQDDILGGTGCINDDPDDDQFGCLGGDTPAGTPGRIDDGDRIFGGTGHDVALGDNALLERPVDDGGLWETITYGHLTSTTVLDDDGSTASFTRVVSDPNAFTRFARDVAMVESTPGRTSGSDLINGEAGDDELYGQFDDTGEVGGVPVPVLCDGTTPMAVDDPNTVAADSVAVTIGGDLLCGEAGEDGIVGDQGLIVDVRETGPTTTLTHTGAPFITEPSKIDGTLTRQTTLTQIPTGGEDVLLGGDDHDELHGGAGDDLANGDSGDDYLFLADGSDAGWGGPGHDLGYGGYGDDFLDVNPRTAAEFPPDGDPDSWFLFAPDLPGTVPNPDTVFGEGYDQYLGLDVWYGGWDQDAMQANEGGNGPVPGDRLVDWDGSYNAYYVCPPTYGEHISTRQMSPSLIAFLENLATAMGATTVTTPTKETSSGFDEAAIVYRPDIRFNANPVHPDTPAHFTCE